MSIQVQGDAQPSRVGRLQRNCDGLQFSQDQRHAGIVRRKHRLDLIAAEGGRVLLVRDTLPFRKVIEIDIPDDAGAGVRSFKRLREVLHGPEEVNVVLLAISIFEDSAFVLAVLFLLLDHVDVAQGIEPDGRKNVSIVDLPQASPTEQSDFFFIGLIQLNEFGLDEVALASKIVVPVPCHEVGRHEQFIVDQFAGASVSTKLLLALDPEVEGKPMLHHESDFDALLVVIRWVWVIDEIALTSRRIDVANAIDQRDDKIVVHLRQPSIGS